MTDPKQAADREKVKIEANEAELTSSPALNDDAGTDSGGAGDQTLPEGNRFKSEQK
ncbi:MAG: hypothetical protein WBF53_16980 [Litorimonas sp.]